MATALARVPEPENTMPGPREESVPIGAVSVAQGPLAPRARLSIRWIVAITAALMIAGAVLLVGAVSERNAREALTREVETRLFLQARNLSLAAADALVGDFPELTLHPLSREMRVRQPELAMIQVLDLNHVIQGSADVQRLGAPFVANPKLRPAATIISLRPGEQLLTDGALMIASVPVSLRDGRRLGTAMVGLRRDYLERTLERARQQQAIVLAAVVSAGILTALIVMSILMRPVAALRKGIERIGQGDLCTPIQLSDRTELGMLAEAVNRMADRIREARSEMVERERLAHELQLARRIQGSLLPNTRMTRGAFEVGGSNRAAQEVGGDYYDFFDLAGGRVGVAIADVSGKGLAGCMVMSMLAAMLRAYRDRERSPAGLLATLDARLGETLEPGSFVTMFYGVLNLEQGELTYASAGHSPLLIYRHEDSRVECHRSRGIPIGAVRGGAIRATLHDEYVRLAPGDMMVQFTDGVNEAFNASGSEQFGYERLERIVQATAFRGVQAVLDEVHKAIERWTGTGPASDDESMLVVARAPSQAAVPSDEAPADSDPVALLAIARSTGPPLVLPAGDQTLLGLREWLHGCPGVAGANETDFEIVHAVLHEICTNIGEHGCGNDPERRFEVHLVPQRRAGDGAAPGTLLFLIRDDGRAFTPKNWRPTDFSDRNVWKRGRGYGLDIANRGAQSVRYHPGTHEGNITLVTFEQDSARKEHHHA